MKDEIVSFDTAKLAKEKGLVSGITVYHTYCIGFGIGTENEIQPDKKLLTEYKRDNVKGQFHLALAPTQSLLQRWLREVHKIDIEIEVTLDDNCKREYVGWILTENSPFIDAKDDDYKSSYEEALEAGLQEALKLISNESNKQR
jgi:hypothetical protein